MNCQIQAVFAVVVVSLVEVVFVVVKAGEQQQQVKVGEQQQARRIVRQRVFRTNRWS